MLTILDYLKGNAGRNVILTLATSLLAFTVALAQPATRIDSKNLKLDKVPNATLGADQSVDKQPGTTTYVIVLDDAAVARYHGGTGKLAATSRRATGTRKLDVKAPATVAYVGYLRQKQDAFLADLAGQARSIGEPVYRYYYAMNGVALQLSPEQAETARSLAGVKHVIRDVSHRLDTDRGPLLIGAPSIWDGSASGIAAQGEGMVVGIMDSGINQGHPSFAEVGDDGYGASGEYAATNPFGAGNFAGGVRDDCSDPQFAGLCNNKLIGSHSFIDAWGGVDQFAPPDDPVSKDTDGHGSHVASTAAGNVIISPPLLDADGNDSGLTLDAVSGVAPHAHIIAYKVCAPSCFPSDIAGAIDQAILDGADALNHSIGASSGSPWTDAKSLAFKGARAAGIMLQNSAGNSGPGAGTAARINASPWATGVAASTHDRAFPTKFLEQLNGGDTAPPADITGRSVTEGFSGPIVYAGDFPVGAPGDANFDQPEQCLEAFPGGTFSADQIVVCDRGAIARVQKARNVRDGGAGAMILANVPGGATSTNDDLHVIPAIHIDATDGDAVRAWLASGAGHNGTITGTGPAFSDPSRADALAGFSSRGPYTGFDFIAPHVAAPGSDIYAAGADLQFVHGGLATPDPNDDPSVQTEFGIISGTSMASPHATGAATLLKQVRPGLSPAEIKSVLMTTGVTDMRKEDNLTPADPFDFGGGRVNLADAARAGLVLDETIANFDAADPALGGDPSTLNLAALVSNTCVLNCSWMRTVRNASGATASYSASGVTEDNMVVTVEPASFTLDDGDSQVVTITADTTQAGLGWHFAQVVFDNQNGQNLPPQHLTIAALFAASTSPGTFSKVVDDGTAGVGQKITYQIDLTNISETEPYEVTDPLPANATLVAGSENSVVTNGSETTPFGLNGAGDALVWGGTLDVGSIEVVSDPFPPAGSPFGYVNLADFVAPLGCSSVCDDTFTSFGGLPPVTYAGTTYTDIVLGSNGFMVFGTDTTNAFSNANQNLPDATAPNTVIAPFWTDIDMDGTDPADTGAGIWYGGIFNGGQFIVFEWQGVERWNEPGLTYTFQIQIGTDFAPPGLQGVWFVYNEIATIPPSLTVGAENENGLAGDSYYFDGVGTAPIVGDLGDLRVDALAGGTASLTADFIVDGPIGDTVLNIANAQSAGVDDTAVATTTIVSDRDGDGIDDVADNCLDVANVDQRDTNLDGFGNICDADLNNDCIVDFDDLSRMKSKFFGTNKNADLNGDGVVNFSDLAIMKAAIFAPPGPSGVDNACSVPPQ